MLISRALAPPAGSRSRNSATLGGTTTASIGYLRACPWSDEPSLLWPNKRGMPCRGRHPSQERYAEERDRDWPVVLHMVALIRARCAGQPHQANPTRRSGSPKMLLGIWPEPTPLLDLPAKD